MNEGLIGYFSIIVSINHLLNLPIERPTQVIRDAEVGTDRLKIDRDKIDV